MARKRKNYVQKCIKRDSSERRKGRNAPLFHMKLLSQTVEYESSTTEPTFSAKNIAISLAERQNAYRERKNVKELVSVPSTSNKAILSSAFAI